MSRSIYLGLCLVLLTGCADNPYAKTYRPSSEVVLRTVAQRREQPTPSTPELVKGTDPKTDLAGLCLEGYVVIGKSKIRGSTASDEHAIAHAKAVGADRVLVYRELGSTEHNAVPPPTPPSTPFAPNGAAIIAGSATTTTFGAEPTRNVPASVPHDTLAVFLVKENPAFGATCGQLGPF
jgi:hypothetical protein